MSATIMEAPMPSTVRLRASALLVAGVLACAGCSAAMPSPPAAVGDGFPAPACRPKSPGPPTSSSPCPENRRRSAAPSWAFASSGSTPTSCGGCAAPTQVMFGERVDDPAFGRESLVDVRTLEVITTGETELTEAEQQMNGSSAYSAAQLGRGISESAHRRDGTGHGRRLARVAADHVRHRHERDDRHDSGLTRVCAHPLS